MKYIISILIVITFLLGCYLEKESNLQSSKSLNLSLDSLDLYKKMIMQVTDNSKYLLTYEAKKVQMKFHKPYLVLENKRYQEIFSPISEKKNIIDIHIDVAKDGGFFLDSERTDGMFRFWKSLIRQEFTDSSSLKIYYIPKLKVDLTENDNKTLLDSDSVNVSKNNNNYIAYDNVLLYEQKFWQDDIDGYILIYMWVKILGDYGTEIEDIRFIE